MTEDHFELRNKAWREYAAAAMKGLLSEPFDGNSNSSITLLSGEAPSSNRTDGAFARRLVKAAAVAADAMLAETERRGFM